MFRTILFFAILSSQLADMKLEKDRRMADATKALDELQEKNEKQAETLGTIPMIPETFLDESLFRSKIQRGCSKAQR